MLVTVIPNTRQIKRWAMSALNAFDDLSTEDALEAAKADLSDLIGYLDRLDIANEAVCESFVSGVETRVIAEFHVRDLDATNEP